jgi:hypothetical protein
MTHVHSLLCNSVTCGIAHDTTIVRELVIGGFHDFMLEVEVVEGGEEVEAVDERVAGVEVRVRVAGGREATTAGRPGFYFSAHERSQGHSHVLVKLLHECLLGSLVLVLVREACMYQQYCDGKYNSIVRTTDTYNHVQ